MTRSAEIESFQILIHVGLHKCGSTWLQKNMFSNPSMKFISPWGAMASISVTEFVAIDPLFFDPLLVRQRLAAAASFSTGVRNCIPVMSHEALSSRPHHGAYYAPVVAGRLKEVFPQSKILLIFREQVSLIHSLYGEHLRNGGRLTLNEFIGTGDEPVGFTSLCQLSFFSFDRLVAMYQSVFGVKNVLALPLEMLAEEPEIFVNSICQFGGGEFQSLPTKEKINTAWGPVTYEILRHSNSIIRGNQLKPKIGGIFDLRRRVLNSFDRLFPKNLQSSLKSSQREKIKARTAGLYEQSNERLSHIIDIDLAKYGYPCK